MNDGNRLFRVRLFMGEEYLEGGVMATSAEEAMKKVARTGAHPLSFFFLSFDGASSVDEFDIYDDKGEAPLAVWRAGWLRLRIGIAGYLRLESVCLSDRIYHRRLP